jgi:hypothetical protein
VRAQRQVESLVVCWWAAVYTMVGVASGCCKLEDGRVCVCVCVCVCVERVGVCLTADT